MQNLNIASSSTKVLQDVRSPFDYLTSFCDQSSIDLYIQDAIYSIVNHCEQMLLASSQDFSIADTDVTTSSTNASECGTLKQAYYFVNHNYHSIMRSRLALRLSNYSDAYDHMINRTILELFVIFIVLTAIIGGSLVSLLTIYSKIHKKMNRVLEVFQLLVREDIERFEYRCQYFTQHFIKEKEVYRIHGQNEFEAYYEDEDKEEILPVEDPYEQPKDKNEIVDAADLVVPVQGTLIENVDLVVASPAVSTNKKLRNSQKPPIAEYTDKNTQNKQNPNTKSPANKKRKESSLHDIKLNQTKPQKQKDDPMSIINMNTNTRGRRAQDNKSKLSKLSEALNRPDSERGFQEDRLKSETEPLEYRNGNIDVNLQGEEKNRGSLWLDS